jgi:serine/threonine-protein kinase/endoribonuclease IRE1
LADIIENLEGDVVDKRREEWKVIARGFDERKAMKQIASGLRHLHGLGLVHRDIKPQNILISSSSSSKGRSRYRMLISDFGLCKKLDVDQSGFLPTIYGFIAAGTAGYRAPEMIQCCVAAGTAGWRAPEMIQSLNTLSTRDDTMSLATTMDGSSSGTSTPCQCLTKSIDIFALGCLFFYILTKGVHPYGSRFDREANITKGIKDLSLISSNEEAHDLITHLLHQQPSERPDIETCLLHPFFWHSGKRLAFLTEVSDRFEIMSKDPMDTVLVRLERDAKSIIKTDWHQTLDESPDRKLLKNLRRSRTYSGNSVHDLLRVLRNKVSLSFKYYNYSVFFSSISTEKPLPRPPR